MSGPGRGLFDRGSGVGLAREAGFLHFCVLRKFACTLGHFGRSVFSHFCDFIAFAVYFSAILWKIGRFLIIFGTKSIIFGRFWQKLHAVKALILVLDRFWTGLAVVIWLRSES